jgi:hypothetical protein
LTDGEILINIINKAEEFYGLFPFEKQASGRRRQGADKGLNLLR